MLHIVRRAGDELAWEAILSARPGDEVRVALVEDAAAAPSPEAATTTKGLTVMADPEYDQIVESMEWADKVVAW